LPSSSGGTLESGVDRRHHASRDLTKIPVGLEILPRRRFGFPLRDRLMRSSTVVCATFSTRGTPGQVLSPDRDGIVVSSVGSCGRFPLWLRSVRLQELSTTLSEIVQRPALALVDSAFQPRALPRLAIVPLGFSS
jgi:hypothetical protein